MVPLDVEKTRGIETGPFFPPEMSRLFSSSLALSWESKTCSWFVEKSFFSATALPKAATDMRPAAAVVAAAAVKSPLKNGVMVTLPTGAKSTQKEREAEHLLVVVSVLHVESTTRSDCTSIVRVVDGEVRTDRLQAQGSCWACWIALSWIAQRTALCRCAPRCLRGAAARRYGRCPNQCVRPWQDPFVMGPS